jgi:hypothetical protein
LSEDRKIPIWRLGALLVCLCVAAFAAVFCNFKLRALDVHRQDYAYYLQFAVRLLDPQMSPRYSINPNGQNILGFQGVDGGTGLNQAIHLEPMKYVDAVLFRLGGSVYMLFLFRVLVWMVPIIYFLSVFRTRSGAEAWFGFLLCAGYALQPSVVYLLSFDLRPYTYLPVFFFLAAVPVLLRRPAWETILALNVFFLSREEAMILAGILVMISVADNWHDKARFRRIAIPLAACWVVWIGLIYGYFLWTGYDNAYHVEHFTFGKLWAFGMTKVSALWPILLAGGVAVLVAGVLWLFFMRRQYRQSSNPEDWLRLSIFSVVLGLLLFQFYNFSLRPLIKDNELSASAVWQLLIYKERWVLGWYAVLLALLTGWPLLIRSWQRWAVTGALGGAILVFWFSWFSGPLAPVSVLRTNIAMSGRVAPLLAETEHWDRLGTRVLCDYATLPLFARFENAVAVQRLPSYMAKGRLRFYPKNEALLVQYLNEAPPLYVVFESATSPLMEPLLDRAGLRDRLKSIIHNDAFVVYQVVK